MKEGVMIIIKKMNKKWLLFFLIHIVLINSIEACTSAIINKDATTDGRPISIMERLG